MRERAALMKVAIKNGIYGLEDIRNKYDEGGSLSYDNWANAIAETWGISRDEFEAHDYDYRKYFNDNPKEAIRQLEGIKQGIHFPDSGKSGTYKKLSHPTYPDRGEKSWSNNDRVFYPSSRQMEDSDRILDYVGSDQGYFNGGAKVVYKGGEVLPTIYVYPNDKGTDLRRNKQDTGWVYKDRPNTYDEGGFFETLDNYTSKAEAPLVAASLAASGATFVAPNPVTAGAAIASNIAGAGVDLYQGLRSAYKGDWSGVARNALEMGMGLVGLKYLKAAEKASKLDEALRASNATRDMVTKTVGRGRGKSKVTMPKEWFQSAEYGGKGIGATVGSNVMGFTGGLEAYEPSNYESIPNTELPEVVITGKRKRNENRRYYKTIK